jgi:hypothetical protein
MVHSNNCSKRGKQGDNQQPVCQLQKTGEHSTREEDSSKKGTVQLDEGMISKLGNQ